MKTLTLDITEHEGMTVCGDGCCHDDGLLIDVIEDGNVIEEIQYLTETKQETKRVIELLKELYGEENVKATLLK